MGEDEFDLAQPRPTPPVFDGGGPAMAGVTQSVNENNGGRMLCGGGEN